MNLCFLRYKRLSKEGKKAFVPHGLSLMASTAKTAITAKTKISLNAMVTLFPKKHGEKLHCTIRYLNISVCHTHVNITELKRFKHEQMNASVDIAIST